MTIVCIFAAAEILEQFLGKLAVGCWHLPSLGLTALQLWEEGLCICSGNTSKPSNGLLQPDFDFIAHTSLSE